MTTAKQESYLKSAGDSLVKSIREGVKEGTIEGLKKGGEDALKECLTTGLANVNPPSTRAILTNIPQAAVKSRVKEGAKRIFKKSTEGHVKKACQRLIKKTKRKGAKLSKEEIGYILKILKQSERETLGQIVSRLPQNPLFSAIIDGMWAALEESLAENLAAYAGKTR
jgi:hypothetical protein